MSRQLALFGLFALFSGVVAVPTASAQTLDFVGYPSGGVGSLVYAVTPDGQTAAGGVYATPAGGFTWTREGGRNGFGQLPGMPNTTHAYGISNDGQVVAGRTNSRAYRYRLGDAGVEVLGILPGYVRSRSLGISGDGEVVVGTNVAGLTEEFGQAFRWTSTTGMVGLGYTRADHFYSEAAAISRDGSTVVGHGRGGAGLNEAFVWRDGIGMAALPGLDATNEGRAFGVNQTGSIIVGDSNVSRQVATMWTNGVPQSLGFAPGFFWSQALAVNNAGTVVVGHVSGATGISQTASIWTPDRGMEPLSNYLAYHGIAVPANVNLLTATSVSADGMTIGGYADFPNTIQQGFVVTIPAPGVLFLLPACVAAAGYRRRKSLIGNIL